MSAPTTRHLDRGRRSWAIGLTIAGVAVGVGLRAALAANDQVMTNDASVYLTSGLNLIEGRGFVRAAGQPELHFPPVTPALLGGAWKLTGDPVRALGVVNVVASSLLLVPLLALARRMGGWRAAAATAWVAALAPGLTEVPFVSGGGSENVALLLLLVTTWLVVTLPERSGRARWATALAAGVSSALLYLTRPEGLALIAVLGVAAVVTSGTIGAFREGRRVDAARAMAPLAAAGVVMVAVMAPYLVHLRTHTGEWQLTAKSQDAGIDAWRAVAENDRHARDEVLYQLDATGLDLQVGTEPLSSLVRDDPGAFVQIARINAQALTDLLSDARTGSPGVDFPRWTLLPLPLALVAAWAAWTSRRDPETAIIVAVSAAATATSLAFFVQARYLMPVTAGLVLLAGVGLARLRGRVAWVAGGVSALLLFGAVAVAVTDDGYTMFRPREPVEHRLAGEWIERNAESDDRVMTRSLVTEFYAERRAVVVPMGSVDQVTRFARHHGVEYLVADLYLFRTFRPELAPLFGDGPWPGLELAHEFEVDGRATRIFRIVVPAPDTDEPPLLGFVGDS